MKIVVTSDWHLDHVTHGVRRFGELRDAVHRSVSTAIEIKASAYLFLGDLCDPDSGSSTFRATEVAIEAAQRLAGAKIDSIWLAGNHDVIEDGSGDTTLSPLRALAADDVGAEPFVTVVERPKVVSIGYGPGAAFDVLCLPFCATSHAYDVAKTVEQLADPSQREDTISISHLNVPGVVPGEETTEMPRGREVVLPTELVKARAKRVINGHYHRQQRTADGVWIPGSLARLTFGEEGNRPGFLVMEV